MRPPPETIIHAGRLLSIPGETPAAAQSIRIAGGKIIAIAPGYLDPPPVARLIDLKDRFVLPGLIDCHVHLTSQLDASARLRQVEDSDPKVGLDSAWRARLTLEAGFTTAWDLGCARKPEVIYALRAAVAEGKVPGPPHPLRRPPSPAHRRPRPDLRLPPRCLRLRAVVHRRRRRRHDACRKAVRAQVAMGFSMRSSSPPPAGCFSTLRAGVDQPAVHHRGIATIIETAHPGSPGQRPCPWRRRHQRRPRRRGRSDRARQFPRCGSDRSSNTAPFTCRRSSPA